MKLLTAPQPLGVPVALAIGVFDGVHLGHQAVLRRARELAAPGAATVAVTFDRHPAAVLAPDRAPLLITTVAQRLRALAALGLDATLVIRFDEACSRVPAEDFIQALAAGFGHLCAVCVGEEFVFGHRRTGNLALLRRLGTELGFQVDGLPAVAAGGAPVSSTRIRELIRAGDFAGAGRLLGRPCALAGPVIRGGQLGRRLGWPTANLDVAGRVTPPPGVYAARAHFDPEGGLASPPGMAVRGSHTGGLSFPAAVNIGHRPSVAGDAAQLHVEAHLIGFEGDLYDRELELEFVARLRDEQRFPSLDELKAQIAADVAAAGALLA